MSQPVVAIPEKNRNKTEALEEVMPFGTSDTEDKRRSVIIAFPD